ncbi:phage tail tape measure protein [Photobacterium galatheae]|uniref:Phage tail tape measure protein domain-containing protein n=1 Tax=Photobacterium galatheae TaxID=1654360 RepID=A0A066RQJ1_9GAMM|nr:phage tail tape measure protein [Photobacterium galatheae]KDM91391.1 hypothetical protein EA58_12590 [Photobacterium galatheae]MCM0151650.1 hypothetical protein [Photobacterium galatheae]
MADNTQSVGIGVVAKVDGSVSQAFSQIEKQNSRLGRGARELSQDTQRVGRESNRTGSLVGRLGRLFGRAGAGVRRYTRDIGSAIRNNQLLRASLDKAGEKLDGLGNQWTGIATGVAGAGSAMAVMGLEERYERLGIQAGKSRDEMTKLRQEMFATAQQSDIRVDQGEMLAAVEKIVEKTGDLEFARENMANIGRVMQATGAAGVDVGEMFADMSTKFGLKNSEDVLKAIDTLVVQGKAGAFTLQNLAAEGAAVSAAYAAMGRSGPKAVQEMGALLQISRMGSGSAAEAASSMESVLADIRSNYKDIEALGIQVFDEEALARGEKKFRDIPTLLKEIMDTTSGDITQYGELFGDEAMRLMQALAGSDGRAKFDDFLAIYGDGSAVLQDSARAAKTANAAMVSLKTAWMNFADQNLAGPIAGLADAINSLDPETLETTLKVATGVGGALAAAYAVRKTWQVGKSVAGLFSRGGDGDGGSGDTPDLPGGDDVSKVYVTNMPDSGMGGTSGAGRRRKRVRRRGARPMGGAGRSPGMSFLKGTARKLPYLGALLGVADLGSTLMDSSLTGAQKTEAVGGTLGNMGGMAAGAMTGAAIGSIIPGIGTAVGGIVGSVIGGFGGGAFGRMVGSWLGGDSGKPGELVAKAQQTPAPTGVQTASSVQSNQSVTLAPVFHIQGEVSDAQITKLEKMVMDLSKKINQPGRIAGPSFSD